MRSRFLLILSLLLSGYAYGQTVKLYRSAEDYLNSRYEEMEDIVILRYNGRFIVNSERCRVNKRGKKVYYTDHALNRSLDNDFWAAERNDSLFVNSAVLLKVTSNNRKAGLQSNYKPYGYEYVFFRSSKYLYFKGGISNLSGAWQPIERRNNETFAITGSLVVAALDIANDPEKYKTPRYHYLYDFKLGQTVHFNRGIMYRYLAKVDPVHDSAFIRYVKENIDWGAGDAEGRVNR